MSAYEGELYLNWFTIYILKVTINMKTFFLRYPTKIQHQKRENFNDWNVRVLCRHVPVTVLCEEIALWLSDTTAVYEAALILWKN